jgi:hypothetical protein
MTTRLRTRIPLKALTSNPSGIGVMEPPALALEPSDEIVFVGPFNQRTKVSTKQEANLIPISPLFRLWLVFPSVAVRPRPKAKKEMKEEKELIICPSVGGLLRQVMQSNSLCLFSRISVS